MLFDKHLVFSSILRILIRIFVALQAQISIIINSAVKALELHSLSLDIWRSP